MVNKIDVSQGKEILRHLKWKLLCTSHILANVFVGILYFGRYLDFRDVFLCEANAFNNFADINSHSDCEVGF